MSRIPAAICFAGMMALSCAEHEPNAGSGKDWTYSMTATIVSRDPAKNTLNLDNAEVPGVMPARQMDYEVRGAKVTRLPPDGTLVDVTVHDSENAQYITREG
jgi:hypothetical protein